MTIFKSIILSIFLIILLALTSQAFAQSLTSEQINIIQMLQEESEHFEIFVLYDDENNPTKIRVLVALNYNRINDANLKILKRFMSSFAKVYIPSPDSITKTGKELLKSHAHCCVVRDSNWLSATHLNWGLPTLLSGCGAAIGFITTCNSPTTTHMISTMVASSLAYVFYSKWKYQTTKVRAKDFAWALMNNDAPKVLALMDKTSARFVMDQLIKTGTYVHIDVGPLEDHENLQAPRRKNLKNQRPAGPAHDQEDALPQEQKSQAELDLEIEEKMASWERKRQEQIAAEHEAARKEAVRKDWKKLEKQRI